MDRKKIEPKAGMSDDEARALRERHPERGVNEEGSFTLRNAAGHRIDPTTREPVPRGYDIATAHYDENEIVPFDPKIKRRVKK